MEGGFQALGASGEDSKIADSRVLEGTFPETCALNREGAAGGTLSMQNRNKAGVSDLWSWGRWSQDVPRVWEHSHWERGCVGRSGNIWAVGGLKLKIMGDWRPSFSGPKWECWDLNA